MKLASLLVSVAGAAASLAAASEAGEPKLDIKVTHEVECTRKTAEMDTIHVHYRGRLAANDKEFDTSYNRGQPFKFILGANQVIKGWDKGLLDMCIGEKRTLTVPPEFGYGNRAVGGNLIPAGSTLIFETELIGINGYDPSKEEKKPPAEDGKDAEAKDNDSPPLPSPSPSPSPTPESDAADSIKAKVGEQVAGAVNAAAGVIKTILIETDDDQDHVEL